MRSFTCFWICLCAGSIALAPAARAADTIMRASWYESGATTADGTRFNPDDPSIVANKTLPFGTVLLLTNPKNGKSLTVTVHDRGPFIAGRSLDLTRRGAELLGFREQGLADLAVSLQ